MVTQSTAVERRYHPAYVAVCVALFIAWVVVANRVADRAVLPLLRPDVAARDLRVTNNDGTLSDGGRLRGWRNVTYFAALFAVVAVGYGTTLLAVLRFWPPADLGGGRWEFVVHCSVAEFCWRSAWPVTEQ